MGGTPKVFLNFFKERLRRRLKTTAYCLPERPLHCPLTTFLVLGRRVTVTAIPSGFTWSGLFANNRIWILQTATTSNNNQQITYKTPPPIVVSIKIRTRPLHGYKHCSPLNGLSPVVPRSWLNFCISAVNKTSGQHIHCLGVAGWGLTTDNRQLTTAPYLNPNTSRISYIPGSASTAKGMARITPEANVSRLCAR